MKRVLSGIFTIFLVFAAMLFQGCGEQEEASVSYRLKWLYNASVAGDLYASAEKYFSAEGLTVVLKEGGPERDAIKELEMGHAQFGVASADQVIRAVDKGAPVVVIAQLFQVNPLQWIYRSAENPIQEIADLKGKTIGITYGANDEAIMRALLSFHGIAEEAVTFRSVHYDYSPFFRREADLWPVYRNSQGIVIGDRMAAEKEAVAFLDPTEHGIRFVANSVVTTRELVDKRPETVRQFVGALLSGWEAAMAPANQEKTVETIARFDPDTPKPSIHRQLDATRLLVKPFPAVRVGRIDVTAWKQTAAIMLEQKLIANPVDVETILWQR